MTSRAIVMVPTYNERENLPLLVEALTALPGVSVLIVDDDSPDGTGAIADSLATRFAGRVRVLHRRGRRGLGISNLDGMKRALQEDAGVICQMDADLSHDPGQVPDLIAATAHADLVIGARYIRGGRIVNWPLRRRLLSRFANWYVHVITRLSASDCTSGFRCWRREALASLPLDRVISDGYSFYIEMLFLAEQGGLRIAEVPITFVERQRGVSKVSQAVLWESAITPWRLAARGVLRRR